MRVVGVSQQDASRLRAGDGQLARADSRRDDEASKGNVPIGQRHRALGEIAGDHGDTQAPLDIADGLPAAKVQVLDPDTARECFLGEGRAVVGEVRLVADDDDAVPVSSGSECLGRTQPAEAGAHDHHRIGHAVTHL